MASTSGRRKTTSSGRKNTSGRGRNTRSKATTNYTRTNEERLISNEVLLILTLAFGILLFLCNFGIIGPVGDSISKLMFGIFGLLAYIAPVFVFLAVAFGISNQGNFRAVMKLTAAVILFFTIGMVIELFTGNLQDMSEYSIKTFYEYASENKGGGGVIAGSLAYVLYSLLDMAGTVFVLIVIMVICFVLITGKSVVKTVSEGSQKVYHTAKDDAVYRREQADIRRKEMQKHREEMQKRREEQRNAKEAEETGKEAEKILRMNKKVSGVMLNTTLKENSSSANLRDDIHEITVNDIKQRPVRIDEDNITSFIEGMDNIRIHTAADNRLPDPVLTPKQTKTAVSSMEKMVTPQQEITIRGAVEENDIVSQMEQVVPPKPVARMPKAPQTETAKTAPSIEKEIQKKVTENANKKYVLPPISLLKPGTGGNNGSSASQLKETALHLQNTLKTFGVNVTVTDISQGPSVTRYELQPEPGVKVSRIVNLADDIKLNLAAADIRIEAPIPGKSAVGIEVPNKITSTVYLRSLLEDPQFKKAKSVATCAVGKSISGENIYIDIAKMPHLLVAGATGMGKSVCINALLVSLLYKATPDELRLILIDPKRVEFSVFNGLPHLLVPVVCEAKKSIGTLQWAVAEMEKRFEIGRAHV